MLRTSVQLCASIKCGVEDAIHTVSDLHNLHNDNHGLIVVNAKNAFNTINRSALLWNVRVLWPRASRFIFNTYHGHFPLIFKGCLVILNSSESVVQGDPLSMFIYAIASLLIIGEMEHHTNCIQIWYADDSSAFGTINSPLHWFKKLQNIGHFW